MTSLFPRACGVTHAASLDHRSEQANRKLLEMNRNRVLLIPKGYKDMLFTKLRF